MSCKHIEMKLSGKLNLDKLMEELEDKLYAEFLERVDRNIGDKKVVMLLYEKLYLRTSSYANLSIMFTEEDENNIYADIFGSGGGQGFFNISWGANEEFAEVASKILEDSGFYLIESAENE